MFERKRTLFTAVAVGLIAGGALTLTLSGAMLFGPAIESRFAPVSTDWQVTSARLEGDDVVMTAQAVKSRSCEYIQPTQAEGNDGAIFAAQSMSPTRGLSWPPSPTARPMGPWRFEGARGHVLKIYQMHDCHPGWRTFTLLGTFDARALE